jgi:hypothetical protein
MITHGQRIGQRCGTYSLGISEAAGDLQDPERVAACVGDQARDDSIRNAIRHKRKGVVAGQTSKYRDRHSLHELW